MLEIQSSKIVLTLVDSETGELFTKEATFGDFKEPTKKTTTRTRKPKTDDEPIPMIHLLEGKYQFNTKAIELTGFEPEMKIDIKFEKKGRKMTPVLFVDAKTGNRLTKTFTVSCKGQKRENLIGFGTDFELVPDENKEGYYRLKGNLPEPEDDIVDVPTEEPDEEVLDPDDVDSGIDLDNIDFSFD